MRIWGTRFLVALLGSGRFFLSKHFAKVSCSDGRRRNFLVFFLFDIQLMGTGCPFWAGHSRKLVQNLFPFSAPRACASGCPLLPAAAPWPRVVFGGKPLGFGIAK